MFVCNSTLELTDVKMLGSEQVIKVIDYPKLITQPKRQTKEDNKV